MEQCLNLVIVNIFGYNYESKVNISRSKAKMALISIKCLLCDIGIKKMSNFTLMGEIVFFIPLTNVEVT